MNVTYKTNDLKKICTVEKEMRKRRGDVAKRLRLRIAALETWPTLQSVIDNDPLGNWHPLHGDRAGQWAGKLSRNMRLIITPQAIGGVQIEQILAATDVEVLEIEDYHRG